MDTNAEHPNKQQNTLIRHTEEISRGHMTTPHPRKKERVFKKNKKHKKEETRTHWHTGNPTRKKRQNSNKWIWRVLAWCMGTPGILPPPRTTMVEMDPARNTPIVKYTHCMIDSRWMNSRCRPQIIYCIQEGDGVPRVSLIFTNSTVLLEVEVTWWEVLLMTLSIWRWWWWQISLENSSLREVDQLSATSKRVQWQVVLHTTQTHKHNQELDTYRQTYDEIWDKGRIIRSIWKEYWKKTFLDTQVAVARYTSIGAPMLQQVSQYHASHAYICRIHVLQLGQHIFKCDAFMRKTWEDFVLFSTTRTTLSSLLFYWLLCAPYPD